MERRRNIRLMVIANSDNVLTCLGRFREEHNALDVTIVQGRFVDVAQRIDNVRYDLLVVELHSAENPPLNLMHAVEQKVRGKFIILAPDLDVATVREFMRAGALDVLPLDCGDVELERAIASAVEELDASGSYTPPRNAVVVNVISAGGAQGSVRVAIEVAAGLNADQSRQRRVCLIDLDFQFGKIATYLDIEGRVDIRDIARDVTRVDDSYLSSIVNNHRNGFDLLCPNDVLMDCQDIRPEAVDALLEAASHKYDFVVVNAPPYWMDWVADLIGSSDHNLVVVDLALSSIKQTRKLLDKMDQYLLEGENYIIVANRYKKSIWGSGIDIGSVEEALGHDIKFFIPENEDLVQRGIEAGLPVRAIKKRDEMTKSVDKIVDHLIQSEPKKEAGGV